MDRIGPLTGYILAYNSYRENCFSFETGCKHAAHGITNP
jgi:hypothetical protein